MNDHIVQPEPVIGQRCAVCGRPIAYEPNPTGQPYYRHLEADREDRPQPPPRVPDTEVSSIADGGEG